MPILISIIGQNCLTLWLYACLGSSTYDCGRIFQNSKRKVVPHMTVKEFSKTAKERSLFHSFIPSYMKSTCRILIHS